MADPDQARVGQLSELDQALFTDNDRQAPVTSGRQTVEVGSLTCESGAVLPSVTVAYETWGALNAARDNAVLVCHALSGDSHAVGWWDRIVGPGKVVDTDRYFVVGTNVLGGCQGTTGPTSLLDDRPYAARFPFVTVGDMVEVQRRLMSHLGVPGLALACGGSMGGMQALEWSVRFPGFVKRVWATASCRAHSAMQIGFNETGRQAIMRDPKWRGGDYPLDDQPVQGLSVARMVGHLSYLSEAAFDKKFGRRLQDKESFEYSTGHEFAVESYLSYQGDKFTGRFDANSYLVLTRAIDYFELASMAGSQSSYLFTSFTSDWIYPSHQSAELHGMAVAAGCQSRHVDIDVPMGHDAFLLDDIGQTEAVRAFLAE
ncbi:MAG: homoserine O-acetyltransferase [Armatimonadetes bacterium]|nr:homoserine O-acetyltransferase [Armatimonadota bacterium]